MRTRKSSEGRERERERERGSRSPSPEAGGVGMVRVESASSMWSWDSHEGDDGGDGGDGGGDRVDGGVDGLLGDDGDGDGDGDGVGLLGDGDGEEEGEGEEYEYEYAYEYEYDVEGIDLLDALPDELIMHMMIYSLSVYDVVMLSSTCKRMRRLGEDRFLWKRKYIGLFSDFPNSVLVRDWKSYFVTKVETEKNWKYGQCQCYELETGLPDTGAKYVKIVEPYVVVADESGRVVLYSLVHHSVVHSFTAFSKILCMDYDGNLIAVGGEPSRATLYSSETGERMTELLGHNDVVTCIRVVGGLVATGSFDGTVRVWSATTGDCSVVVHHLNFVSSIDLDGAGTLVSASRADRHVKVWDLESGSLMANLELRRAVTRVRFNGSELVASLASTLRMELWDLASCAKKKTLRVTSRDHVSQLQIDGRRLVTSAGAQLSVYDTSAVSCINIGSEFGFGVSITRAFGAEIEPLYALSDHGGEITSLAFDEWRIVSASATGVKLWNFVPPDPQNKIAPSPLLLALMSTLGRSPLLSSSVISTLGIVKRVGWSRRIETTSPLAQESPLFVGEEMIVPPVSPVGEAGPSFPVVSTSTGGVVREDGGNGGDGREGEGRGDRVGAGMAGVTVAGSRRELSFAALKAKIVSSEMFAWPVLLYVWYLWIAYESGVEYSNSLSKRAANPMRKWVRSSLIWFPLALPAGILAGFAVFTSIELMWSVWVYVGVFLSLLIPWVVHSYKRPKQITQWMRLVFSVLEFGLVVCTCAVLMEMCESEFVMWRLHCVVSAGYSVGKGLLYSVAALEPSRQYEMQTTLFYTPLIGLASGTAFAVDGARSALLIIVSIVFSFLYGATGGATGDIMDNMFAILAASFLGVAFPFSADLTLSAIELSLHRVLLTFIEPDALDRWWTVWLADHRTGYRSTYLRLAFFFVVGSSSLGFIKFIRNGARFHVYRAPLIRVSFWVYWLLLGGTVYDMFVFLSSSRRGGVGTSINT